MFERNSWHCTYSRIRSRSILVNSSSAASNWSSTSSASSITSSSSTSGIFPVLFDDIVQRHVYFLDLRCHLVPLQVASCVFKWRDEKLLWGWNCCLVCMSFDCGGLWKVLNGLINFFCACSLFVWTFRHGCKTFIFRFFFLQRWHQRFRDGNLPAAPHSFRRCNFFIKNLFSS